MDTIDKPTALLLAELLAAYGVRRIVVSAGSRCAPLVVVLSRCGRFELTPVIDERSAAFVGLGMALRCGEPVALVCTSGSAVLNYAPALAEAYYRRVPLIAVSADRPADMIDQRDSQTIRQPDALAAVVRKTVDIPDRTDARSLRLANRLVNEALTAALGPVKGPVHINMQFDAPLTPLTASPVPVPAQKINFTAPAVPAGVDELVQTVPADSKVLVVAGGMHPSPRLARLLASDKWITYAEVQANMPDFPRLDIRSLRNAAEQPDIVVSIGGAVVSAALKYWLRSVEGLRHISVGYDDNINDTFGCVTDVVQCEPERFFEALESRLSSAVYRPSVNELPRFCGDLFAALESAFADADIHFSNGMSVRYGQKMRLRGRVESNRGVSGIEGATSTAIGSAMVADGTTVLVTGDMSAAYDVGALAIANIPPRFKMVVLDNGGGDIFRAVATTRSLPEREQYFTMPPRLPLRQLAQAYGFAYFEADASDTSVNDFVNCCNLPAILKVKIEPGDAINHI